jgi:hypothetical protein
MENIKNQLEGINSLKEIELWLIENNRHYIFCKENNIKKNSCFHEMGCACSINSEEAKFSFLYEELLKVSETHKLERYAKEELQTYEAKKNNNNDIKDWLVKNEKIASEELASFLIDYLDYSENETYHLLVYRNVEPKFEIFIQRSEFKNLIEYKELFDELYYIKKMYPEGLKRIEEEINKLPKYIT